MKVSVTVTPEHAARQKVADCFKCAFAISLNEYLAPGFVAWVSNDRWFIQDGNGHSVLTERLPHGSRYVLMDLGCTGRTSQLPHTFTTDIPRKYLRVAE